MYESNYYAKDGNTYQIQIDDDGELIEVFLHGDRVGTINMQHNEEVDDHSSNEWFHITHLSLDACKRRGIGRECLKRHKEVFDCALTAGENDGMKSIDGSHLVGDGPGFIARMREEGLVVKSAYDFDRDDYQGSF